MDELIKHLIEYAEWAEKRPLEIPILLPVYLRQAADELEKWRWVSVEERLPDNLESVIWWIVPDAEGMCGFAFPSTFDEEKGMQKAATHWIPLPSVEE